MNSVTSAVHFVGNDEARPNSARNRARQFRGGTGRGGAGQGGSASGSGDRGPECAQNKRCDGDRSDRNCCRRGARLARLAAFSTLLRSLSLMSADERSLRAFLLTVPALRAPALGFIRVLAMAEAATMFAALPGVPALPRCTSRTQCSMQWQRQGLLGGGSVRLAFGVGKGRVVALRAVLRRGVCRAAEQNSDGVATSSTLEVVYDPQSRFEELSMELKSSSSAPISNLTLFSPSKVNVFLRITGKRPDGYHNLASLFHVISLGDIIKFSVSPSTTKDSLTTNAAGVPLDGSNLIMKAFNLYREKTGTKNYFWVHLDKQVPTGAGLGGGSGNAATALWAANQMNGNIVSEKELQEWSGEIGADCPFFFSQGAAYCTNKGEVVQNIPPPIPLDTPMVLIKPPEECSTVEVYKRFSMDNVSNKDPEDLLREIAEKGISQSVCVNDLEPPAFEVLPTLKALKERVLAASRGRYQAVFMSGSGSTIVGVGDSQPPQFIYDEDKYSDVFVSEAYFLTRKENEWYQQPTSEQLEEYEDKTCSIEKRICE